MCKTVITRTYVGCMCGNLSAYGKDLYLQIKVLEWLIWNPGPTFLPVLYDKYILYK